MYISKSSLKNGVMKWSAVNSDTEADLYGEKMTVELYQKMLGYIKDNVPPPEAFRSMVTSNFWNGGMPYVSIAHYPDLNGKAVPGKPLELFIDGNQLKARGILFENSLGKAVFKSLKLDEIKSKSDTNRIRISIAFLDLAHKHGENGEVFVRNSNTSVCKECKSGKGDKIYLDGYLVHLALTRVPVNTRTIMTVEKSMAKDKIQTRKEDAQSIVGEQEAEAIDKLAFEEKSEALVEMSDTEVPEVEEKEPVQKSLALEDIEKIAKSVASILQEKKVEKVAEDTTVSKSALDLATDNLYTSISNALSLQGVTLEQRLESINPSLQELGNSITALVRESMGVVAPTPKETEDNMILEALSVLTKKIDVVTNEVATMKAQSSSVQPVQSPRVPVPRSISPSLVAQSQIRATSTNLNSIRNIVRRSVSSDLPIE